MKSITGAPLDLQLLEEDRKRIQNLRLFNRVSIAVQPEQKEVVLRVQVTEQWYIFPFPILFLNDRDWSKLSYGAGLMHNNFRGRAETLSFAFWFGYNPSIHLDYSNPWIGSSPLYLYTSLNLFIDRVRSKHFLEEQVTEKHIGGQWTLGKRFGFHTYLSVTLGYKDVVLDPIPQDQASIEPTYSVPYLGLGFVWDKRDLKEYPHAGWILTLWMRKMGLPSRRTDYLRWGWDVRTYLPIFRVSTLALRSYANLASGEIPVYDRVYLGYSERIRGHFFERLQGEHVALWSLGFRFPLIPVRYYKVSDDPYLSDLKFGVSMGFFAESGLTWSQSERFDLNRTISGFGGGIHLHLPYIDLLRLEIALNETGKAQFLVDLFVDI
jgi:outer membrane protein assembly factor BamA